ncbi:hypothetical protein DL766_001485 [Monosporascus sp. MC13-8B]|uniref:Uncharacterized protein n=1 Tax=Monosporascus cannonballus TaxID=155416 RepID=A0ABY0H6V7_9PEZI|nr:hypothetical protein DL762_006267 [Monosporascus cannonballus]RYO99822.1 hypothetical protein DL763_001212 [Monosporascus cannonballus]RYP37491.1 hypothetical protein DL766_001485 [Monosporascus sp. MC13-8B]
MSQHWTSPVKESGTAMPAIEALGRWARLKKYQIEVTYGVYVFTPGERLVFWTIFCLLFSLVTYYATLVLSRNLVLVVHSAGSLISAGHSRAPCTPRVGQLASIAAHAPSRPA